MGRIGGGGGGYMPPRPSVGQSQPPLTSPCPPSNHTRIEYWDRAGGGRNIVSETSTTNEVRIRKWMRAAQKGLKMSCIHPFGPHNWTRKTMVLTCLRAICGPKLAHFQGPFSPEKGKNCSKWDHSTCLCNPKDPKKIFGKKHFLIHF